MQDTAVAEAAEAAGIALNEYNAGTVGEPADATSKIGCPTRLEAGGVSMGARGPVRFAGREGSAASTLAPGMLGRGRERRKQCGASCLRELPDLLIVGGLRLTRATPRPQCNGWQIRVIGDQARWRPAPGGRATPDRWSAADHGCGWRRRFSWWAAPVRNCPVAGKRPANRSLAGGGGKRPSSCQACASEAEHPAAWPVRGCT